MSTYKHRMAILREKSRSKEIETLSLQLCEEEIKVRRLLFQKKKLTSLNVTLRKKLEVLEKMYNDCRRRKIHIYKENIVLRIILLAYTIFFSLFLLYR